MYISYRQILKQAWEITIANKVLWIFGIFASFVSLENIYEIILGQIVQAEDPAGFYQSIINLSAKQSIYINKSLEALSLFKFDWLGLIAFMAFGAIVIFLIWLALTSQIFIIKSANQLYHRKNVITRLNFQQSDERFWPVLILQILTKLILYAGFVALSLPLIYLILTNQPIALIYANIVFFILYIIFSIVINFLAAYAVNFIVLKNLLVIEALSAGWKLFKNNVLISIEIATVLFFLKLLSLIVIFSLFMLFFLPVGVMLFFSLIGGDLLAIVLCLTVLILAFLLISLFINAVFTTFYLSCWTITFIKLTEETLFGKILNWLNNLPRYLRSLAQKNKVAIDENKIKKQASVIALEANNQAKILRAELNEKYKQYKPIVKKQGKKLIKQTKAAYTKYEPVIKKEGQKMAKDISEAYKKFEPVIEKKAHQLIVQAKKEWPKDQAVKPKAKKSISKTGKNKKIK
jgi:hypothetical protein